MREHANQAPQGTTDEACVCLKPSDPGKQPGSASHTMPLLQGVVSPGVLPEDLDPHPVLEDGVLRDCGCSSVGRVLTWHTQRCGCDPQHCITLGV